MSSWPRIIVLSCCEKRSTAFWPRTTPARSGSRLSTIAAQKTSALVRAGTRRQVRVMSNLRTPGLAGSQNIGLLAAEAPLVAFCDDDDAWRPEKLLRQTQTMAAQNATACVAAIEVHYGDKRLVRNPGMHQITPDQLSGSRLTVAHPSTYLLLREHLLDQVGLVDEDLPYGYGEDYDLLLRSAQRGK